MDVLPFFGGRWAIALCGHCTGIQANFLSCMAVFLFFSTADHSDGRSALLYHSFEVFSPSTLVVELDGLYSTHPVLVATK